MVGMYKQELISVLCSYAQVYQDPLYCINYVEEQTLISLIVSRTQLQENYNRTNYMWTPGGMIIRHPPSGEIVTLCACRLPKSGTMTMMSY